MRHQPTSISSLNNKPLGQYVHFIYSFKYFEKLVIFVPLCYQAIYSLPVKIIHRTSLAASYLSHTDVSSKLPHNKLLFVRLCHTF